ncbi:twin-arginine translocase TatA/TatE family subunit [Desulfovibrio intestinalis]|uniref:Sec-independent protein translocase protein TatA n=1 Tax=Desulfovibrio intestinalis TaxID=58621 RepID=A0A7W8C2F6_9BACT|nr:TatA/E family protein of Tat protein translocase [Desulfovibrio intestinalis]
MGALSIQHLLVVLVVVIALLGAKKLPVIGSGLGKTIKNFTQATSEQDEVDTTSRRAAAAYSGWPSTEDAGRPRHLCHAPCPLTEHFTPTLLFHPKS